MRAVMRRTAAGAAAIAVAGVLVAAQGASAQAGDKPPTPRFTSAYTVKATPGMVVDNAGNPVRGERGARGTFEFRINSDAEIICYDIEFTGVTPPYQSPARTATHIHEASAKEFGPPRLAFPNPVRDRDGVLRSSGCMRGPFTTGVNDANGNDTGKGFSLSQIENDPRSFYADTHTADFPAGAIRGQLREKRMGGAYTTGHSAQDGSVG